MGEITLLQWMKEIIGNISFRIFLWTINKTQDEYFTMIYNQERNNREVV